MKNIRKILSAILVLTLVLASNVLPAFANGGYVGGSIGGVGTYMTKEETIRGELFDRSGGIVEIDYDALTFTRPGGAIWVFDPEAFIWNITHTDGTAETIQSEKPKYWYVDGVLIDTATGKPANGDVGDGCFYVNGIAADQTTPAPTAKENIQTVQVDGKDVSFAMYTPDNGETNYVRLRDLAVALNGTAGQYNVGYDEALGRVLLTAGEAYEGPADVAPFHEALEYEKTKEATYVNGKAVELEALRFEYNNLGYSYYKIRDLGQALGFNVGWDNVAQRIYIESDKAYDPNN